VSDIQPIQENAMIVAFTNGKIWHFDKSNGATFNLFSLDGFPDQLGQIKVAQINSLAVNNQKVLIADSFGRLTLCQLNKPITFVFHETLSYN
jgi:hypothetical protein